MALNRTRLFSYLKDLFTPRVVAGTLILIAFTLTPMIMDLITATRGGDTEFLNLVFALVFVYILFIANKHAQGIWKSTLNIWAILIGTLVYNFFFSMKIVKTPGFNLIAPYFYDFTFGLAFDPGVIISFLFCFTALAINDLGSIQSLSEIIRPDSRDKRITAGIFVTGLGNILAGFFGVIGPVNFSLSPGVVISTGCASRYTLIPMALGLLAISFFPGVIAFIGAIPSVVLGSVLVYIMCSQIAAGLEIAFNAQGGFTHEQGLVMGLGLMLSIIVSFLPPDTLNTFPAVLRPVLGNGFVMGVVSVLIMEHLIFKERTE